MKIIVTEEEILSTPNYYELGMKIHTRYLAQKERREEVVESITTTNEYDVCNICGKQSPYLKTDHIDIREGYIEGSGQGCFNPINCNK